MMEVVFSESAGGALSVALGRGKPIGGVSAYIGMTKEEQKHIFERFYKSSPNKNSIGIGLNLTKSILDKTNATIRVQSEENKYTKFTIHFYKSVV